LQWLRPALADLIHCRFIERIVAGLVQDTLPLDIIEPFLDLIGEALLILWRELLQTLQ
jgi:hypothetical protein